MNFSQLLLEFLKKEGQASVPGFGVFYLNAAHAVVDKEHILPPREEIVFTNEIGETDHDFTQFFASQKNMPLAVAEDEIKKQVTFWTLTLEREGRLSVENFGTFYLDDSKIHFKEERTDNRSPDYYGLEEIDISKIKKPRPSNTTIETQAYRLPRSVYWVVPLLIGVLAITYFGITQPEMIFGKRSFIDFGKKPLPKTATDSLQKDSANIVKPAVDSAKTDSLSSAAAAIAPPAKKWSPKKYSKSKWKKNTRKRQNR